MNNDHQYIKPASSRRKGQTSLVMILLLAIAFIFYAITLNWSRIATLKTNTWMAAVSASSQAASMFTSYGERVIKEQLEPLGGLDYNGGNLKYCKGSYFLLQLLFVVIAAVIAYFTVGLGLALVTAVLLTTSVVLQEYVIHPMLLNSWNKLYSNLQPADQFREIALSTAMQQIVSDPIGMPDRFDMNANGKWGFTGPTANDEISRYGLFYTERLKHIKPPDTSAFEAFRAGISNLVDQPSLAALPPGSTTPPGLGFSPYCNTSNRTLALCNSECTGLTERGTPVRTSTGIGWQYNDPNNPVTYVPLSCQAPAAAACNDTGVCPQFQSTRVYNLVYDSSLETAADPNNARSSFRNRLGHDDEIGKSLIGDIDNTSPVPGSDQPPYAYNNPDRIKGLVFPFLNEMAEIDGTLQDYFTLLNAVPGLSPTATTNNTLAKRFRTTINPLANYFAQDNQCAREQDSANGFFWKKGSDKYCSSLESNYPQELAELVRRNVTFTPSAAAVPNYHYPYTQCRYMYNSGDPEPVDCPSSNSPKQLWPQDRLDEMVSKLSDFVKVNNKIQKIDSSTLVSTAPQWYRQVSPFIAPRCSSNYTYSAAIDSFVTTNFPYMIAYASNPDLCNPDEHGYMIQWMYDLRNWTNILNTPATGFLNKTYGDSSDLCSGTVAQIGACFTSYTQHLTDLNSCNYPSRVFDANGVRALPAPCVRVIRKGFDLNFDADLRNFFTRLPTDGTIAVPTDENVRTTPAPVAYLVDATQYDILKAWIFDNRLMKQAIKDQSWHVNVLANNGAKIVQLFQEGYADFNSFLAPRGPADTLMKAIREQTSSIKRLPSFAIYGWKDENARASGTSTTGGLWHLARVEVKQPSKLPWIRAYKSGGFFNRKTCFEYTDGNNDSWVRATRWDEDFAAGTALFANGIPIWQFKFKNPNPNLPQVSYTAADLQTKCIKNGFGVGLTQDTLDAIQSNFQNNPPMSNTSDEAKNFRKAFMINIDPRTSVPNDQPAIDGCALNIDNCGDESTYSACCNSYSDGTYQHGYYGDARVSYCQQTNLARCVQNKKNAELRNKLLEVQQCFYAADALLNVGVKTAAGARYGVPNSTPWHSGIFFHSASETKDRAIFDSTTFNDVPTEI